MRRNSYRLRAWLLIGALLLVIESIAFKVAGGHAAAPPSETFEVNDSHLHLTNYVQEGTDIHDFLNIMGTKVGRVAIFAIPLRQQWFYGNTGSFAATYYLQTDRVGGLGCFAAAAYAFAPLAAVHGAMLFGPLANRILHLGARLPEFTKEIVALVVLAVCALFSPLLSLHRSWRSEASGPR